MTGAKRAMLVVAVLGFVAAAAGLNVRSSYGARLTGDEPHYLLTARSLARDGDLHLADEIEAREYAPFHESTLRAQGPDVAPHDPLLPLLLAPTAGNWVAAKLLLALCNALLAALLVWTCVRRLGVSARTATVVVAVFAASAPFAVYGSQIYPELPAALVVACALALLLRPPAAASGMHIDTEAPRFAFQNAVHSQRRGEHAALAVCVAALPWLSVKYIPIAATLAVLALVRMPWRRAAVMVAVLAAVGAVFAATHLAWYGGLTPYAAGSHFEAGGQVSVVGYEPNLIGRTSRVVGLLVDRQFGLAAWQPAWLAIVPAALRRRHWTLTLPLAAGWLGATFVAQTMHGWWWPGRQLVVALPAAVLLIAVWASTSRARLAVIGTLGVAGVATYAWVVADGLARRIAWVVDFFETSAPTYRIWRHVLPDYMQPSARTWVLHGAWIALLLSQLLWNTRLRRQH